MISVYTCCVLNFKFVKFTTIAKKKFGKQRVSPPRGAFWITLNDTQIL